MVEMKRLILCLLVWFWPNVVPVFTVEQCSLWQSADVRSISFRNSLRWSIYIIIIIIIIIINSVNKTKLSRSHLRNTTVSSETYPLYSVAALYQDLIWLDRFPKNLRADDKLSPNSSKFFLDREIDWEIEYNPIDVESSMIVTFPVVILRISDVLFVCEVKKTD